VNARVDPTPAPVFSYPRRIDQDDGGMHRHRDPAGPQVTGNVVRVPAILPGRALAPNPTVADLTLPFIPIAPERARPLLGLDHDDTGSANRQVVHLKGPFSLTGVHEVVEIVPRVGQPAKRTGYSALAFVALDRAVRVMVPELKRLERGHERPNDRMVLLETLDGVHAPSSRLGRHLVPKLPRQIRVLLHQDRHKVSVNSSTPGTAGIRAR